MPRVGRLVSAKILLLGACLSASSAAIAQDLLPQGIGLYQYGYRSYAEQGSRYDAQGDRVPLGEQFNNELTGNSLRAGKGGSELKRLADELANYGAAGAALVDSLDLGEIHGDVKADINAQFIGFGYGVNRKLTLFLGVPWVSATVRTEITHSGSNNADTVAGQLGGLAYAELMEGLERAGALNALDVKDSIESAGYAPVDEWSHSGMGDLKLGAKTGFNTRLGRQVALNNGLTLTLDAPTGYTDDPDILTDVGFGRGYYSLALTSVHKFSFFRTLNTGADLTYAENFQTQLQKRVPVADESLVDAERKATVTMRPGDDTEVGAFIGVGPLAGGWIDTLYRVAGKRHFSDSYSGSLDGNYESLADGSSSYLAYQEVMLTVSSAEAYRRRGFALPFILSFKARQPLEARDTMDERYYEAQITSFFSTPAARNDKPARSDRNDRGNRRGRGKLAH